MRAVIQRVSEASVTVAGREISRIGPGMLILLGVETGDGAEDAVWMARKIAGLRIFSDAEGLMNRSVSEAGGDALVVSQFTLLAMTKKGNRPSYIRAARPEEAIPLYESFTQLLQAEAGCRVGTGEFGADMRVSLVNDGPVTLQIDSRRRE